MNGNGNIATGEMIAKWIEMRMGSRNGHNLYEIDRERNGRTSDNSSGDLWGFFPGPPYGSLYILVTSIALVEAKEVWSALIPLWPKPAGFKYQYLHDHRDWSTCMTHLWRFCILQHWIRIAIIPLLVISPAIIIIEYCLASKGIYNFEICKMHRVRSIV